MKYEAVVEDREQYEQDQRDENDEKKVPFIYTVILVAAPWVAGYFIWKAITCCAS